MDELLKSMMKPLLEDFLLWKAKNDKWNGKTYNPLLTREEYTLVYAEIERLIEQYFQDMKDPTRFDWDDSE